jgi:hypothetical protein
LAENIPPIDEFDEKNEFTTIETLFSEIELNRKSSKIFKGVVPILGGKYFFMEFFFH